MVVSDIDQIIKDLSDTRDSFDRTLANKELIDSISLSANAIIDAFKVGNKLLLAGNGGSAADAQHLAGEFVSRFLFDRDPLPAIALTTDTSILTAVGNDYGYDQVFARQVRALGRQGDVLIAISTSGKSPSILQAIEAAKKMNIKVIGFTGSNQSNMSNLCDILIQAPDSRTPFIQQIHITVGHIICSLVERAMFDKHDIRS